MKLHDVKNTFGRNSLLRYFILNAKVLITKTLGIIIIFIQYCYNCVFNSFL